MTTTVHFSCNQTLKQETRFSFSHKLAVDIFSEFSILGTLVQMQRKFPYFKTHLTTIELPSDLQLEVINVLL